MNESTINDLKEAIRRLEAEKRQIEEQHRSLVAALRYFENSERKAEPSGELPSYPIPTQGYFESSDGRSEPRRQHSRDMRDAMVDILAREGPLHRRVIHKRLVEMGVRIGGQDPVNNVGAHLSIDPRFKRVGGGIWDLNEPPAPDAKDSLGQSDANADHDQHDSEEEEDRVPW